MCVKLHLLSRRQHKRRSQWTWILTEILRYPNYQTLILQRSVFLNSHLVRKLTLTFQCSELGSPARDDPSYQLNTPQMHANLHTEFIHSVSFLMSEDLNAHLFCGVTRNQHWHSQIQEKLDRAQIVQLKCLIGSGLACSYKSWLEKSLDGTDEFDNIFNPNKTPCCSDNVCENMCDAGRVASHSKPCLFVSNMMWCGVMCVLLCFVDNSSHSHL